MNTAFTLTVQGEIRFPDIALLAQAMMGKAQPAPLPSPAPQPPVNPVPTPQTPPVTPQPATPAVPPAPAPAPAPAPVNPTPAPVGQMPPVAPPTAIPAAPSAPAPSNSVVPGTEPPKYSIDDIARAGAELAQQGPDKITALTGLLQQFGLQAVTQLRPDQMGPFVMALRGLGARI